MSVATQARLSIYGPGIRRYFDQQMVAPHFHVCRGPRPGGHFLQSEAGPVRDMVLDHVTRVVKAQIQEELA